MQGILPVIKKNSGCDYHRIILPMKYLGFDIESVPQKSTDELLAETKIFFFNRKPEPNNMELVLAKQKKFGFKIVVDLDDFWILNTKHPMYETWNRLKMGEEIVSWLKHADAVTTTTSRLAEKISFYNKNVHVIPNALPFDQDQFTADRESSEETRYIYTGQSSHLWDVGILKVPFSKINNHINKSKFILAGFQDHSIVWKRMESTFNLAGKLKGYERMYNKPLDHYMDVYNTADVSLVPLEANIFTPYKSNIKILEAGCKNIPVICSHVPPYSDEAFTGTWNCRNSSDWVSGIKLFQSSTVRKESGLRLGEEVREKYNLVKVNEYRKQLFEHLMN